jgi:transglycosylase-like protein with SLT domain
MPTVIDSLLVTLGLDSKGFKEGAAEAERAQEKLKDTAQAGAKSVSDANTAAGTSAAKLGKSRKVESEAEEKRQREGARRAKERHADEKKRTDATIAGLKTIGIYAAGALIGFESLKGAIAAYADTNTQLAGIGRLAPTIGASVEEVGSLGNALAVVGGRAEDAADAIGKLSAAQTSIKMHAPDQLAGFTRYLGVSLFDEKGQARDKIAILKDIGVRLRQITSDTQDQANYARQMGLNEATIQLFVLKQADARDRILKDAEATNRASLAGAKGAQDLASAWSRAGNVIKGLKQSIVGVTSEPLAALLNQAADFLEKEHNTVGLGGGKKYGAKAAPYMSAFSAAEKKYGLPSGLLAGVAQRESNFDPTAVNAKSGARGLMQLNPQYFPNAGANVAADIDTAAAELSRLYRTYRAMYPPGQAQTMALRAYNMGEGKLDKALKSGKPLPKETQNYAPGVIGNAQRNAAFSAGAAAPPPAAGSSTAEAPPTAMNRGGNVYIDEILINTAATDARGIAGSIGSELQREGVITQANAGLS